MQTGGNFNFIIHAFGYRKVCYPSILIKPNEHLNTAVAIHPCYLGRDVTTCLHSVSPVVENIFRTKEANLKFKLNQLKAVI